MDVTISDAVGKALNARVEVSDEAIVVHSRSGPDRNRDYKPALEAILTRLDDARLKPTVYLDSKPVSDKSLSERVIAAAGTLTGPVEERFNQLVRAMNAGSNSHGAWRRIRLGLPGQSRSALAALIRPSVFTKPLERLTFETLNKVRPSHVRQAADEVAGGHPMPGFAPSRDYDLVYDDTVRLAPKHVFGRALELATGIVAHSKHFTGGVGTPSFRALEDAGFEIVPKGGDSADAVANVVAGLTLTPEEQAFVEGSKKRAWHLVSERNRKLVREFKAAFLAEHGKFFCEKCEDDLVARYDDAAASCFDAHHAAVQVAAMPDGHESRIEDLQLLCANCHRAEHQRMRMVG